jgi:ribonuclease P protein component
MPSERFTKASRLRRRGEFQHVFDLSHRVKGRYLTMLLAPNRDGGVRLGIVASKKLGDSVRRNRAKRLIRELFRLAPATRSGAGVDLVVIPRRELFDASYASLESEFRASIARGVARLPQLPADAAR